MVVLSVLGALGLGWLWLPLSSGHVAPVAKVSAPGVAPSPVHHSTPSVVALSKSGVETKLPSLTEFQMFSKEQESKAGEVVLDLRPLVDFCGQHIVGATSMPADQLERRMLELPTPSSTQSLTLVGNEEELRQAREILTEKQRWLIGAEISANDMRTSDPAWPTEVGSRSVQAWRANEFLEFCTERYLLPRGAVGGIDCGSTVLDLGCGCGRDAVYLAQQLPPGTRIIGIDSYSGALDRAAKLAERWLDVPCDGASGNGIGGGGEAGLGPSDTNTRRGCEWLKTDLRKEGSLDGLQASVVHGHRFLSMQALPWIRDEVLLPGGYFIWSTYMNTATKNPVPPWRPSRMTRTGELADFFSGDDFEILVNEQGELRTRGCDVPAMFFLCRKKVDAEPPL